MKKTFVIASTKDRFDGLCSLIKSLSVYLNNGWNIAINFQKYEDKDYKDVENLLNEYPCEKYLFRTNEYNGCSLARIYILERVKSDIWCSLDDDMEITPLTNYEAIVDYLIKDKTIGFVSSNWAKTYDLVRKKNIEDKLIRQKIVFTGGGLIYREDVAQVIRDMPREEYLFENPVWSVYAYIKGYENYRYLGSASIHKVCTKG